MCDLYTYLSQGRLHGHDQLSAVDKSVQNNYRYAVAGGEHVSGPLTSTAHAIDSGRGLPNDPHASSARGRHRLRQRLRVVFVQRATQLCQAYAAAQRGRGRAAPGVCGGE
jgi:hypothetical protein